MGKTIDIQDYRQRGRGQRFLDALGYILSLRWLGSSGNGQAIAFNPETELEYSDESMEEVLRQAQGQGVVLPNWHEAITKDIGEAFKDPRLRDLVEKLHSELSPRGGVGYQRFLNTDVEKRMLGYDPSFSLDSVILATAANGLYPPEVAVSLLYQAKIHDAYLDFQEQAVQDIVGKVRQDGMQECIEGCNGNYVSLFQGDRFGERVRTGFPQYDDLTIARALVADGLVDLDTGKDLIAHCYLFNAPTAEEGLFVEAMEEFLDKRARGRPADAVKEMWEDLDELLREHDPSYQSIDTYAGSIVDDTFDESLAGRGFWNDLIKHFLHRYAGNAQNASQALLRKMGKYPKAVEYVDHIVANSGEWVDGLKAYARSEKWQDYGEVLDDACFSLRVDMIDNTSRPVEFAVRYWLKEGIIDPGKAVRILMKGEKFDSRYLKALYNAKDGQDVLYDEPFDIGRMDGCEGVHAKSGKEFYRIFRASIGSFLPVDSD